MKSQIHENSLQVKICAQLQSESKELQQYTIKQLCYMIFKNLQWMQSSVTGLRLTTLGFKLVSKQYQVYKFPLTHANIQKSLLIKLHTNMKWPYYIDKKNIYLFSGDDAMWLTLTGTDIDKFANDLE